jgi:hypothetical protein
MAKSKNRRRCGFICVYYKSLVVAGQEENKNKVALN